MTVQTQEIVHEVHGCVGFITLNRPKALNALSLSMIRALSACLLAWRDDERIHAVAIRGSKADRPFGHFCAGGDIRFFHQALLAGDPSVEDFFTEEYALDHLIHCYPKPYLAFMDGVVMGGGMGISQGASHRIVTSNTTMAMPETDIGLFPDVGGGYFLGRCPGSAGEWLGLTGSPVNAEQAIVLGLADHLMDATRLPQAWDALKAIDPQHPEQLSDWIGEHTTPVQGQPLPDAQWIDQVFSLPTVSDIVQALESHGSDWAGHTLSLVRKRSPLMQHVTLAQVRRARHLSLAEDLRMERDMMRHVFYLQHLQRSGAETEAAEGIRALVIDKDRQPRWNPLRLEDVTPEMVDAFFVSPWPAHAHPLRKLS